MQASGCRSLGSCSFATPRKVLQQACIQRSQAVGWRSALSSQQAAGLLVRRNESHLRAAPEQQQQQPENSPAPTPSPPASVLPDSDAAYLAKLLVVSLGGAAALKWGSLLSDVPFDASPAVALALVLGTPLAYAALLLLKKYK